MENVAYCFARSQRVLALMHDDLCLKPENLKHWHIKKYHQKNPLVHSVHVIDGKFWVNSQLLW